MSFLLFLAACSEDDELSSPDEVFMSARIDGMDYHMTAKTSSFTTKRIVTSTGMVKLKVEAISAEGQSEIYHSPIFR